MTLNEYGETETLKLLWAEIEPEERSRQEFVAQDKKTKEQATVRALETEVYDAVKGAGDRGVPLKRSDVRNVVGKKAEHVSKATNALIAARWLHELDAPALFEQGREDGALPRGPRRSRARGFHRDRRPARGGADDSGATGGGLETAPHPVLTGVSHRFPIPTLRDWESGNGWV